MDARHLTAQQRQQLIRSLREREQYFWRLHQRMRAAGWISHDPTFQAVLCAYHAARSAAFAVANVPSAPASK